MQPAAGGPASIASAPATHLRVAGHGLRQWRLQLLKLWEDVGPPAGLWSDPLLQGEKPAVVLAGNMKRSMASPQKMPGLVAAPMLESILPS